MSIIKAVKFASGHNGYNFYHKGKRYVFVNGSLETKDPQLISALRNNAYFNSDFFEVKGVVKSTDNSD